MEEEEDDHDYEEEEEQEEEEKEEEKEEVQVSLSNEEMIEIIDILRHQKLVEDKLLEKVMKYNKIPKRAVSLEVDVMRETGVKPWMRPPLFWTGESMKPTKLVEVLFGKKEYYGFANQPQFMSSVEAGQPETGAPFNPHADWIGRRTKYQKLLEELELDFKNNCGLELQLQ